MSEAIPIANKTIRRSRNDQYRRSFIAGASYFFTVNLAGRSSRPLIEHIDWLREAIRYTQARYPFEIDAVVVLPDHLHAIWTLPQGDSDYVLQWRLIKTVFSRQLAPGERRSQSRWAQGVIA